MQMDIYERDSYIHSISNLVMLKAFYDKGVDVTKLGIQDYFVEIQGYSMDNSVDILVSGLNELFDDTKILYYDELESNDNYKDLFDDGIPEHAIFLSHSKLDEVLLSKYAVKLVDFINNRKFGTSYVDVEFAVVHETREISVQVWFPGQLHEIAMALIEVLEVVEKLHQTLESEKKNGISDNYNRQIA